MGGGASSCTRGGRNVVVPEGTGFRGVGAQRADSLSEDSATLKPAKAAVLDVDTQVKRQAAARGDSALAQLHDKVHTHVTSAAEATRMLGEAGKDLLFRLLDGIAGQMSRLTVFDLKLLLGKSIAASDPLTEPLSPSELQLCIEELGLRGEVFVLSEVLERHHGNRVTRQSLLAGLVAMALGSFGDKVSTLFVIFDESLDGRLQVPELRALFFAICAFKPTDSWDAESGLQPDCLAQECTQLLGKSTAEQVH
ncbi:hypothetical protein T492DRAFT_174178 [Pavlovales sp. CCMP2436]|nr:hypothetical protein T492DRAFT_174178 [Pavlovales sp. CCMP2436]